MNQRMGRTVDNRGAAEYAAAVKTNIERAIHEAGFPGYYQESITMECLARIVKVLDADPADWFPTGPSPAPERSGSQHQDQSPTRTRSETAQLGRWTMRPATYGSVSA